MKDAVLFALVGIISLLHGFTAIAHSRRLTALEESNSTRSIPSAPATSHGIDATFTADAASLYKGCKAAWESYYSTDLWLVHFTCRTSDRLVEMVGQIDGVSNCREQYGNAYALRVEVGKQFSLEGVKKRLDRLLAEGK